MITNKLEYHINSKLREDNSVSGSNFFYKFDIPDNLIKKINKVSLTYATIPKSVYVIEDNDDRNKFEIWKNGVGYITITLTEGNYVDTLIYGDNYDIKKELKNKLDAATGDVWTITRYLHPTTQTGKFLYECSDTTDKKFRFSTYESNINQVMGFHEETETEIFTTSIISTSVCNLNKNNTVYLVSDICITDNKDKALHGQNVLDCIYISQNRLLSYTTSQHDLIDNMKDFNYKNNSIFNFVLYNENGLNIELNGVPINFTIVLFTYTPYENMLKKISNFIDFILLKFGLN